MLLGIDIGTSSCKAALFDTYTGQAITGPRAPLDVSCFPDGGSELDMDVLWNAILNCMAGLCREHPAAVKRCRAVGVSVFFPTLLPLDKAGTPLRPALLYNDLRSQPQVDALNREFGREKLEAIIGNRLCPGTGMLPGIRWFRENQPELAGRTALYTQVGEFITWKLCGGRGLDSSQASLSALCSAGANICWNETLMELAGITTEQLPPLVSPLTVLGGLKREIAEATGLPAGIPVICASGDAPLSALGSGICGPGQAFVCQGSTDNLILCSSVPGKNPVYCNVHHVIPGTYITIGTMNTGGAAAKWFCENMMHCSFEDMTVWAEKAEPGSGGVVFLPYLQGERTPYWDSTLRGQFKGLGLNSGRSETARAVLEGVGCAWRQILSMLEEEYNCEVSSLVCAGGGAGNRLWNKIKASITGKPLHILKYRESGSLGACLAGGLGAGIFKNAEAAAAAAAGLRETETVEPVAEWAEPLEEAYTRYLTASRG